MSGRFITFEGIDGCGKTTQLTRAAQYLERDGRACVVTREPGGTEIAERIRELVMSVRYDNLCTECELLLYLAARAQHVIEVIAPARAQGKIVLCDRFQEATFAYQGFGRGVDLDTLGALNTYATGGCSPDLTLVFDLPVDAARARLAATGRAPDRIEASSAAFFKRVREGYHALAAQHPHRVRILDATRTINELAIEVAGLIRGVL